MKTDDPRRLSLLLRASGTHLYTSVKPEERWRKRSDRFLPRVYESASGTQDPPAAVLDVGPVPWEEGPRPTSPSQRCHHL